MHKPSYSGYGYCQEHFRGLVERRVRKDLRTHQPLDIDREYVLLDDGSPLVGLCESLLKSIFGGRLRLRRESSVVPGEGVIVPSCLEMDASALYEGFLRGDASLRGIRPLRTLMVEDIEALIGDCGLSCKAAHPLLASLESSQPGTFFGVLRSLDGLGE